MIITEKFGELCLITQSDHAALAARLFSLWRRDGIPQHPRRKELLLAIREHDNGWREEDAALRLNPESGFPYSFSNLPSDARLDVWKRGVHRLKDEYPYATQLIARHAEVIHTEHWSEPGWMEFGDELVDLEDHLRDKTGLPTSLIEEDYGFLGLGDTLSLGACGALSSAEEVFQGYRHSLDFGRIRLDPFPLAGATTLEVPFRLVPREPFSSPADLAQALASARWQKQPVRIEPLGPSTP